MVLLTIVACIALRTYFARNCNDDFIHRICLEGLCMPESMMNVSLNTTTLSMLSLIGQSDNNLPFFC